MSGPTVAYTIMRAHAHLLTCTSLRTVPSPSSPPVRVHILCITVHPRLIDALKADYSGTLRRCSHSASAAMKNTVCANSVC